MKGFIFPQTHVNLIPSSLPLTMIDMAKHRHSVQLVTRITRNVPQLCPPPMSHVIQWPVKRRCLYYDSGSRYAPRRTPKCTRFYTCMTLTPEIRATTVMAAIVIVFVLHFSSKIALRITAMTGSRDSAESRGRGVVGRRRCKQEQNILAVVKGLNGIGGDIG